MKYFLKKIVEYSIIMICFMVCYGSLCDSLYKDRSLFLGNSKRYWQLSLKNRNFNYAVFGSSRAYGTIDIELMDSITNEKGINMGLDGSGFKEILVNIKLFLLNKNKVDKIYLQIDPYSFMSKKSFSNSFHTYSYLPFWDLDKSIQTILKEETPIMKESPFYIPYLTYFIFNNYYSPIQIIKSLVTNNSFENNSEFDSDNGNKIMIKNHEPFLGYTIENKFSNFVLNEEDYFYYLKILKLAEVNNIEIYTFTAPLLHDFDESYEFFQYKISSENYFESDFSWKGEEQYFENYTHLNYLGRKIYTLEFSNYLIKR